MAGAPRWVSTALRYLVAIVLVLLVLQYLLGIYTNVYGVGVNADGKYSENSSGPALDWHYNVGFLLGILGIVLIVLAALSRTGRLVGQAVGLFVWVLVAGVEGMMFVRSNDPLQSLIMAFAFLLAFGTGMGMLLSLFRSPGGWMRPAGPPA